MVQLEAGKLYSGKLEVALLRFLELTAGQLNGD
jgi:hypothetical protein